MTNKTKGNIPDPGTGVIFLDVDGVLNHRGTWDDKSQRGPWRLCPAAVARFNRVVAATGAQVVISSSWRGNEAGERKLHNAGVLKRWHKDKRTPRLNTITKGGIYIAKVRGEEIDDWLSRHPEVRNYVIVDDESDMLDYQKPRFVQTDFHDGGLLDEHCERIAAILAPPASPAPDPSRLLEALKRATEP